VAFPGRNLAVSGGRPGSPAQQLGLRTGDVLIKIAGEEMSSVTDFARAFKRHRMANTVMLLVGRDGRGYHVRLRV
jgi:S1-C subfamily serine protease